MKRFKAVVLALGVALALTAFAAPANAAPAALNHVNCATNAGAIHVNVPYVPYTYCYAGVGTKHVSLTQVTSVESRNWTVTVLWHRSCCGWFHTGMISGQTLWTQGGLVDTISVP